MLGIDNEDLRTDADAQHRARVFALRHGVVDHRFPDDGARAAVGQAVVDLVALGTPVQRRHDDAGELAGPVQSRHLPAVLQHHQQVVALA